MLTYCLAAVSIAIQVAGYSDIPRDHWAAGSVERLTNMGLFPPGKGKPFQGEKPVTRYEFAVVMDKFVTDIRRSFLRQPIKKKINTQKIRGRKEDGSQTAMIRLAEEGFLPYYSPIFHGPKDAITPDMLSIALSQIAKRIAWCFQSEKSK
ncbi:MAG TPA: S-layer homology domain-containing protein [Fimbriimonadales bacterium]|nr:S-layer homology domain-containing protein [Fimbriimonadales bacterium]